jgi:hypothetical protein
LRDSNQTGRSHCGTWIKPEATIDPCRKTPRILLELEPNTSSLTSPTVTYYHCHWPTMASFTKRPAENTAPDQSESKKHKLEATVSAQEKMSTAELLDEKVRKPRNKTTPLIGKLTLYLTLRQGWMPAPLGLGLKYKLQSQIVTRQPSISEQLAFNTRSATFNMTN